MPGTISVFGHSVPRTPFIATLVIAGAGGAYLLYRHHQQAGTPAPAAGYGYSAGTGYGLGIASYGYGYGTGYGQGGGFLGGGGGIGVGTPVPPAGPGYGYGGGSGGGTNPPTTNAQWAAAAEAQLEASGYNPTTVAAALGKYLTGGTLTLDQQSIVQAAIAVENYPPVRGANGFPPQMHVAGGSGQTPDPGSGKGKLIGHRHMATGTASMDTWAKGKKTTRGEIVQTTEKDFQSGYMTTAHHTAFNQYLSKGTSSKMPAGLVFFSTVA
jgi:hypothetical protein